MLRQVFFALSFLLTAALPGFAEETHLHFDCGVYYFSDGPYATQFQFEEFMKKTEGLVNEDFERVEGDIRGSAAFLPRYFMGALGDDVQRAFEALHPAIVLIEGDGGVKVFDELTRAGKFPRVLIYLNAPDAASLKPDFPVDKVISIFGTGAPEASAILVENPARDFNLRIQGASHVNLWQDSKLQGFVGEVIKIALLESLFPPEKKEGAA